MAATGFCIARVGAVVIRTIVRVQSLTVCSRPRIFRAPGGLSRAGQAQVAELVDALASGASGATCGGSSPLLGTNIEKNRRKAVFFRSD